LRCTGPGQRLWANHFASVQPFSIGGFSPADGVAITRIREFDAERWYGKAIAYPEQTPRRMMSKGLHSCPSSRRIAIGPRGFAYPPVVDFSEIASEKINFYSYPIIFSAFALTLIVISI
jgi:hypothetical protein